MSPEQRIILSPWWLPWWFFCGLGLLFASFGAYGVTGMLFGLNHIMVSDNGGPSRLATPTDALLPGVFLMIGLIVSLIRYRSVLDVERRVHIMTTGWGLWVTQTEFSLGNTTSIDIGKYEARGVHSGRFYMVFPIMAIGPHGSHELAELRTYAQANELAQRIAAALGVPIGIGVADSTQAQSR